MSLFEIEINEEFKILNSSVFLEQQEVEKLYKLNTLNDQFKDDISKYFLKKTLFKINYENFVINKYEKEIKEISKIVQSNIYDINKDSDEKTLYPEWILFYIAIFKKKVKFIGEEEFFQYIHFFKYIAEIRYKKYFIRNVKNFICRTQSNYSQIDIFQERLHNEYIEYVNKTVFSTAELYKYLNFLYNFYIKLKENEKYKLMWNLETYILETIRLLMDNNVEIEEIYLDVWKNMRGTYSVLHEIYPYKPLFIKESKFFFQSHLKTLNNILEVEIDLDNLMEVLTRNKQYEEILFSYIELLKRFNATKMNETLVGSLVKTVVLGVEEIILKKCVSDDFFTCIKKFKVGSHKFSVLHSKIQQSDSNEEFFKKLNKLISDEENSLEKYLMVYYHARNYLAHNNIDMNQFFWGEDGKRIVVATVIDAIMIILYKLETIQEIEE